MIVDVKLNGIFRRLIKINIIVMFSVQLVNNYIIINIYHFQRINQTTYVIYIKKYLYVYILYI
jgi:hypothetical protein